jgi:hypothetical protein
MQFIAKPKLVVDIHIGYKADIINNTSGKNIFGPHRGKHTQNN